MEQSKIKHLESHIEKLYETIKGWENVAKQKDKIIENYQKDIKKLSSARIGWYVCYSGSANIGLAHKSKPQAYFEFESHAKEYIKKWHPHGWYAQLVEEEEDMYSCCGDDLDPDIMMCPTCKEHC